MPLSPAQLADYHRDGYIPVEGLLTPAETDALRSRIREYTHGDRPRGSMAFQTEPRIHRGEFKVDHPGDGIRKIDGLVEYDDLFRALGTHPDIVDIVEQILGPDIKMFRNSLLLKPPEVGSAKGMHQDSPYWPIEPMSLCSCWFAIDDATPENGCMAVIPGAHAPLPHVSVTDDFVIDEKYYDRGKMVLAPLKADGGLFFHSLTPHYTAPNRSKNWRRAIALSYMSAKSRFTGKPPGPEYLTIRGQTYPDCVR
ncbi:MAG: phytanoyl-CoA dioxygenase family protein [Planctomycetes bacterium]|nr:phytanoyl-CoA dioxygenase family protein [Planctomycetota bacterium]